MDPQLTLKLPAPILGEIISFSVFSTKLTFRITCKRFLDFINTYVFPTFTTTLCGATGGYKDGDFIHAQFNGPSFGVMNFDSTILFISDRGNRVVRKIDLSTNQVITLCGSSRKWGRKNGVGNEDQLRYPSGLALHEKEKLLYVSDSWNHVIKSINLINGKVETLFGNPRQKGRKDGIGKEATFYFPKGLALDSISNSLYVADNHNNSIRKILLSERKVETLCGTSESGYRDGSFDEATFHHPWDIAWDSKTQKLYTSDYSNHTIRVISLENKTVSTFCGTPKVKGYENGGSTQAKFRFPRGLELDVHSQCLYVTDGNHTIRKISLLGKGKVSNFCGVPKKSGDKGGLLSTFNRPEGLVLDPHSSTLYVMDCVNSKVKKIICKK